MPHPHAFLHNYQHHIYRRPFMICGPSRLVWFGIGSVATWAWIRHHEKERLHGRGHGHGHGHGEWCPRRVDYPAQTQTQTQNASREWNSNPNPMMGHRDGQGQAQGATIATTTSGAQGGAPQPPQLPSPGADQDYERLRQMGRNAEETVSLGLLLLQIDSTIVGEREYLTDHCSEQISGMSEATIDSMMGALKGLKDVRSTLFPPTFL
jgi:hypothetical protein